MRYDMDGDFFAFFAEREWRARRERLDLLDGIDYFRLGLDIIIQIAISRPLVE